MKKTHKCKIISKEEIANKVYSVVVERPQELNDIKSGQFFNIQPGEDNYPLLRRPISVSMITEDTIEFIIIENGFGTSMIKKERLVGESLDILGPLGNGYTIEDSYKNVLIVGGGIGIAPQRILTKELKEFNPDDITVIMGFRDEPYCLETYEEYADNIIVATESGKVGHRGYVTEPLKNALESKKYDMVFACGPEGMLKSVNKVCEETNTKVQLLMEERMACGIGACLVCTCKIKDETKEYRNLRTCKDGPVFFGEEVIFND